MVNELGMTIMCMHAIILTMSTHLSLYRVNTEISSVLTQLQNMDPKEPQGFHRKYQLKLKSTVNTNPGPVTDDVLYRIIYEDGDGEDMYDVFPCLFLSVTPPLPRTTVIVHTQLVSVPTRI